MIQSSHRRTEKKKNRSFDIFEDKLPMINAAYILCLDFPAGLVSAKHKTLDIQIVLDWTNA